MTSAASFAISFRQRPDIERFWDDRDRSLTTGRDLGLRCLENPSQVWLVHSRSGVMRHPWIVSQSWTDAGTSVVSGAPMSSGCS